MKGLNKRGSMYVEATMVIPVTFLITLSLIGILLGFHENLLEEIRLHKEETIKWSQDSDANYVRRHDVFKGVFEK